MIYGIGTDIVHVARMQQNLDKFGERFAARILTEQELADYSHAARPAHFLAKRFAAKEATAKAMGTGFRNGLSLRHIEVGHDTHGKPLLILTGQAEALASQCGICESHLSLADENEYAVAFVTLVNRPV
jgi:holo-[acyl-carrier protein] synthase